MDDKYLLALIAAASAVLSGMGVRALDAWLSSGSRERALYIAESEKIRKALRDEIDRLNDKVVHLEDYVAGLEENIRLLAIETKGLRTELDTARLELRYYRARDS